MAQKKNAWFGLALVAAIAGGAYAWYKTRNVASSIQKLRVTVSSISNFRFSLDSLTPLLMFDVEIAINNPSANSVTFEKFYGNIELKDKLVSSFSTSVASRTIAPDSITKINTTITTPIITLIRMGRTSLAEVLVTKKLNLPLTLDGTVRLTNGIELPVVHTFAA